MLGEVAKVFGVRLGGSGTVICTVLSGLDLEDQFQIHSCLKGTLGVYTSVRPGCLRGSTLPFLRVSNPNVGENRFFFGLVPLEETVGKGGHKVGQNFWRNHGHPIWIGHPSGLGTSGGKAKVFRSVGKTF